MKPVSRSTNCCIPVLIVSTFVFVLTLLPASSAMAQEPPASWSVDVMSGASIGYFTLDSRLTPHAGFNVRYSLNPTVSLYGNFGAGQFRSAGEQPNWAGFENDYLNAGLGLRMNVLRMISGPTPVTETFGVYGITGLGLIFNHVEVSNEGILPDYPAHDAVGSAMLYRFGGGLSYRISRRVDMFMQAEVNFSDSELLDGHERATGAESTGISTGGDAFLNTSAGISIKFGSSDVQHADWYRRDHRIDPLAQSLRESLRRIEDEMEVMNISLDANHDRIQSMGSSLDDLANLVNVVHSDQFMSMHEQIERLQNRLELLQYEIEEMSSRIEAEARARDISYFVVAGVFRNIDNAERLLRELKASGYQDSGTIRDRSRNYYLVHYNGFAVESEAHEKLNRIREQVNPDAWIYVR